MRPTLLCSLVFLCLALAGCSGSRSQPTEVLTYRIAVDLKIGGEQHLNASAVQELGFKEGPKGPWISMSTGVRGDALVIDLGTRGALLLPLTKGGAEIPYEAMIFWACGPMDLEETAAQYSQRVRHLLEQGCDVPLRALPMFIWMPSLDSSDGFKRVRPEHFTDVLRTPSELISVRLEATNDSPSSGIESTMVWMKDVENTGSVQIVTAEDLPVNQQLFPKDFRKSTFH
jgi:hypothetical protein